MLQTKIALIYQTGRVSATTLTAVAAALQTQVNRDLAKFWPVSTTVTTLPDPKHGSVPLSTWPIYIVNRLPPGEGGYHWVTGRNQPYSVVEYGPGWTVAASHECVEMSIDAPGNRLQSAPAIVLNGNQQTLGTAEESYLVEIADPCEAEGYAINGVPVSDFITPNFYLGGTTGLQYSFTGAITRPMQILPGGYISWLDPTNNHMLQLTWLDPSRPPVISDLGLASVASLKEHADNASRALVGVARSNNHAALKATNMVFGD